MNKAFMFLLSFFVAQINCSEIITLEQMTHSFENLKDANLSNDALLNQYKTNSVVICWIVELNNYLNKFKSANKGEQLSDETQALVSEIENFLAPYEIEKLTFLNRLNKINMNIAHDMFYNEYLVRFNEISEELEYIKLNMQVLKDANLIIMVQAEVIQKTIYLLNSLHLGANNYFEDYFKLLLSKAHAK